MTAPSSVTHADRTVSENLRAVLARRRIHAIDVAEAIDIPARQLRRRLRAEVGWSLSEVMRVADYLDLKVSAVVATPDEEEV